MKRRRLFVVALLLLSLLMSSCGQAVLAPQSEPEAEAVSTPAAAEVPAESVSVLPLAASGTDRSMVQAPDGLFRAQFEGNQVKGSGEVVDGAYRIVAEQTDGEAWHVKLESNYPTVAGRDYRITYRFRSDVAGLVKFGDFQEFEIQAGENSVTAMKIADSGNSYLDLQLGALPPFTIDVTEIEVEEFADEVEYADALTSPINFEDEGAVYEHHDQGYAVLLERTPDQVTAQYVATSWENAIWKARLYVRTGLLPKAGTRYYVSADVTSDQDTDLELIFNNGEEEKGYGALYGQKLTANETGTFEAVISVPAGMDEPEELVIQFSLGNIPEGGNVTVNNVRVETITDHYTSMLSRTFALDKTVNTGRTLYSYVPTSYTELPLSFSYTGTDTVYEGHDDDYVVSLEESSSSATLRIEKAPEDRGVWKVKLFAATGLTLEAGTTYRIRFDLKSEKDQAEYEVCFDGNSENAYGALYGRSLTAGGTDSVDYTVTPEESAGALTLRLQLGKTDTTAGNTFTLSNLRIETVSAEAKDLGGISYQSGVNVWEEHGDGIEQSVSASGSSATLSVSQARSEGGLWSGRLFVATGVTPEAGARYRVSANVASGQAFGEYEMVFDNGGAEAGYGKLTGQWASGGSDAISGEFTAPDSGCGELVLRFQLGESPAGNSITVSDIQVCKMEGASTEVPLPGFNYPVTTDASSETIEAAYVPQPVSLSVDSVAWDGFDQNVSVSDGSAILDVFKERDGGGIWSSQFYVGTGVKLEPGEQYRVSCTLHSVAAIDEFQLLFSNGVSEDDGFNPGGKGYHDGQYGLSVGDDASVYLEQVFTAPERSEYRDLNLRFQMGMTPVPNTVTVSGVTVEKWVPEHTEETGGSTEYNSFDLEANNGTAAELTGDGSSASATVTVPGDDWHIKLYAKPGIDLEAGKTYQISLQVSGGAGTGVFFKRVGGEEDDFGSEPVSSNSETVTHTVTPDEGGTLEILLKLGNVAPNTKVTVSDIHIFTLEESVGENLMNASLCSWAPINFWAHEDYAASLSNTGSSASLAVNSAPDGGREPWKIKLFAETGFTLSAGTMYRISADVAATNPLDYEICYNDGAVEKGVGAKYGLSASSGAQTVSYEVTPEADASLILQFSLGNAVSGTTVTVSNVKVEELTLDGGEEVLPSFSYDSVGYINSAADSGYIVSLEQHSSSADFHILQAPAERNPWNVKLNVRTGFTPQANKGYRVSFDIDAASQQDLMEVFYDGSSEAAYGALYGQNLPAGKRTVSYTILPGASKGELSVQIRLGKTNGTEGNSYTISNLKLEEVAFTTTATPETHPVTELWTHDTYRASLEKTADRATVRMENTPADGMEPWKTKLFVETGVTLKAGQKYRICMDVKSIIPTPFEVCFNNGEVEKGLGAVFGLMATPTGQPVEYVTYVKEDTHLVIQLSLGNCAAPNSIMLTGLAVEKAGAINPVSDTIYTF